MIVAILFCLINNEVIFQVKKFFADRTGQGQGGRHPSLALTQYTVSLSHSFNEGARNLLEPFSMRIFQYVRQPGRSPSPQPPPPLPRSSFYDANGEKLNTTSV